ncbi:MAG: hypothetical protein DRJ35_00535 [Thermoprotei archaeon]|nr:MAG: hypothetical protein DRJ35_00535 [Thermoprotei archaeon]
MFTRYRRDTALYTNLINRNIQKKFDNLSKTELEFMSEVARADFINFVMVEEGFLYEENGEELAFDAIIYYIEEEPLRIDALLSEWIDVWSWKWKQRVKLVLQDDPSMVKAEQLLNQKLSPVIPRIKNYNWFRRFTLGSLINVNEVCFTNLLSDSIVKGALFKVAKTLPPDKVVEIIEKNPMFVIEEIVSRVKELKAFKGNLVVVRLNPKFFEERRERLVEWW